MACGFLLCFGAGATSAAAQRVTGIAVNARTVLHPDDTKTDSTKDPIKLQQTEKTFDARGVVIAEKVFILNQNGDPTQGIIYDGAGNLVARVNFYFDDLGRVVEERCLNSKAEIFRRVIRQYDKSGRALPPQAFDYKVNAPHMTSGTIDFTNMPKLPPKGSSPDQIPTQPGQSPQVESAAPGMRTGPNGTISVQPQMQAPLQGSGQTQPTGSAPPPAEKKGFRWPWQKK
jgi:hypothetical protein